MPRYNVEHNGKWACFSSIVDAFVTEFMDKDTYEEWRKVEYGIANYEPVERCNRMTMKEAVFSTTLNRTREEVIECLLESGLTETESEQLIYVCETKYNCPRLQDDGSYICPNCHDTVKKGQIECENETCCKRLVWR